MLPICTHSIHLALILMYQSIHEGAEPALFKVLTLLLLSLDAPHKEL